MTDLSSRPVKSRPLVATKRNCDKQIYQASISKDTTVYASTSVKVTKAARHKDKRPLDRNTTLMFS